MDYSIKNINGFTEQDLKNLNDNFKYIRMKLFESSDSTTSTITETTTTETASPANPSNEIELAEGNIIIYATCQVTNEDGSTTIKKTSYTLKPDGLYNYAGKLILPIGGINNGTVQIVPTFY